MTLAMIGRFTGVRPLRGSEIGAAQEICASSPVEYCLAASRLAEVATSPFLGTEFRAGFSRGTLVGLAWTGANLYPVGLDEHGLLALGEQMSEEPRRSSSIVGRRRDVEILWPSLARSWPAAREERWSQPLLVLDPEVDVAPPDGSSGDADGQWVRAAVPTEAALVYPASVAMFTEEVGYSPTAADGGRTYRNRVGQLVSDGRTYVRIEGGKVVFKADVGAIAHGVAQIHGVWVDPERRGEGLGTRGMAATVAAVRRDHAPRVSLYVNGFNEPARRAYAAVGFRQVGELATILL